MEQSREITRTRPANQVLRDHEERLRAEGELPNRIYTKTLELAGDNSPSNEQALEAAKRLLSIKHFHEAVELYSSIERSKEITEQKKRESDEKSRTKELSEKEKGWGDLMTRELERKSKLLQDLSEFLTERPKKIDLRLAQDLRDEIMSQARMFAAYERVREEKTAALNETIKKQVEYLKSLGDRPVTEYLGRDRHTWVIRTSEIRKTPVEKDQEREHFA